MRRDQVKLQNHAAGTAELPMVPYNGLVIRKGNRRAPENDVDHSPREFRRYVDASGAQQVQLDNGLHRRIASGLRLHYVSFLYGIYPIVPGEGRDVPGGKIKRGMGFAQFDAIREDMAQPAHPQGGGVGKIASDRIFNPGTS